MRAHVGPQARKLARTGHKRDARRLSIFDRIELRFSRSKIIDGLWIGTWIDPTEQNLRRVEEALALIKTYDPITYGRLIRDLRRVWVRLLPDSIGSFKESLSACQLDTRFVLDERSGTELIAAVIVHEAAHARLRRCGFGYEEEARARVEAVCIRREAAFARRLPNGDRVREWAEASLKSSAVPDIYTDAAREQRYIDGGVEALRHLGAPEWMGRSLALLLRLKRRFLWSGRRRK